MPLGLIAKDSIQDLANFGSNGGKDELKSTGGRTSLTPAEEEKKSSDADSRILSSANEPSVISVGPRNRGSAASIGANPQQAPLAASPASSYGAYTGFHYDSAEYGDYFNDHSKAKGAAKKGNDEDGAVDMDHTAPWADGNNNYFYHDSYAPMYLGQNPEKSQSNLWCCIFPWLFNNQDQAHLPPTPLPEDDMDEEDLSGEGKTDSKDEASGGDQDIGDADSTNSNQLGEKLSDRERQAVLARLRLAQPEASKQTDGDKHTTTADGAEGASGEPNAEDPSESSTFSQLPKKGLLNGIPVYDTNFADGRPQVRSILKRRSVSNMDSVVMKNGDIIFGGGGSMDERGAGGDASKKAAAAAARRRSLFPSYETNKKPREEIKPVRFAPMARVVTVTSRKDMSDEEKGDIWWRRSDYEDFRRTGRIITRAMLEGGSEIWLASYESKNDETKGSKDKDKTINGDKWWHKFGHSRRGLEHVVSIEEGRQRQVNVKSAIRAVLDEQARQSMYRKVSTGAASSSTISPDEKLRNVSLHHTQWARDLALAAGASDADAVESSFAEDRRSREFYLFKLVRTSSTLGMKSSGSSNRLSGGHFIPQFMQPAMQSGDAARNKANLQQRLDANTAAQLRFRRQQQQSSQKDKPHAENKTQSDSSNASVSSDRSSSADEATTATEPLTPTASQSGDIVTSPGSAESCEPVHDPDSSDEHKIRLAQKAAGFSADEDEKVNMAAVLSGMGVVTEGSIKK